MTNPEADQRFVVVVVNPGDFDENTKTYLFGPFPNESAAIEWRERDHWMDEVQSDMDGALTYQTPITFEILRAVKP